MNEVPLRKWLNLLCSNCKRKKTCAYILNIGLFTHSYIILRSLIHSFIHSFIHSLSLKQNERVYLDNCSYSWLSSQVRGRKKKERASQGKSKKTPFPPFFPSVWQRSMHVYVCVSRARKKQIKNSSIGSNRLRLYTWQHQSIQHTFGLFDINNQTISLLFLLNRSSTIVSFVSSFVLYRQSGNNI